MQLRAAAAVVSKRADDEALHAKQQLASLRSQFQQHQVHGDVLHLSCSADSEEKEKSTP